MTMSVAVTSSTPRLASIGTPLASAILPAAVPTISTLNGG